MPLVYFRTADYDDTLRPVIFELLDKCVGNQVKRGDHVLVKPNLLAPSRPDQGVLAHPLIVRSVSEYLLEKGANPLIADSPATRNFRKILRVGGFLDTFDGLEVPIREFRDSRQVDIGEPFGRIDIAREVLESDLIINIAKLKTHSQMLMTLGVKNTFGCIVGYRKPEWHMRCGIDPDLFAKLLVRIHQRVAPAATIVDGIIGMEGDGPGKSGTPRRLNSIIAGRDAHRIDAAICHMIGLQPEDLPTIRAAKALGNFTSFPEIDGHIPEIGNFRFPVMSRPVFGPGFFQKFMRMHLLKRPTAMEGKCKICGECISHCPARAISEKDTGVVFDYDKCIRCYCCTEICPHGAIGTVEPLIGKIVGRVAKGR